MRRRRMNAKLFRIAGIVALLLAITGSALAQQTTTTTTQTTAVQNPDGSWTVVEYPVDKEVTVNLSPAGTIATTTTVVPSARILRSANGTVITLDPAGFAGATSAMNLYAVDPVGHVTLLGPINAASTTPLTFNTDLNRFMLVVS